MPREVLRTNNDRTMARVAPTGKQQQRGSGLNLRVKKEARSRKYLNLLKELDASVHGGEYDQAELERLISAEFPGFDEFLPIGLVGRCYLGPPYEVHTLDRTGHAIIHHYTVGEALPGGMEQARNLALHPSYEMIEVYQDRMVCVMSNGAVIEMEIGK